MGSRVVITTAVLAAPINPITAIPDALNPLTFVQQAATGAFEAMANSMAQSAGELFKASMTFWVGVDSGGVVSECSPQAGGSCANSGGAVLWLQDSLHWLAAIVAVISLMVAAGKMIVRRDGTPAAEILGSIIKYVIASAIGLWAIAMVASTMDEWSKNILTSVGGADKLGSNLFKIGAVSPGGLFILGLSGVIVACLQIGLLLFRDFILIFLAGVLPLAAAASSTASGSEQLNRIVKWTLAFLFYKPVAALIYAIAFIYMSDAKADLRTMATGLMAMIAAIVALPALMRLVAPIAGAATGRGGGAMAVGTAVATGAVMTVATGGVAAPSAGAQIAGAGQQGMNNAVPQPQNTNS